MFAIMELGDKVLLLLIVALQLQLNGINALECLKCDRVVSPRHCHGKTTCTSNEYCYVDQITGYDGETYYNVGCRSKEFCDNPPNDVMPQRKSIVSVEQMTCSTCCQGNLCNNGGCGAMGYPAERGPVCYTCQQSANPKHCDMIAVCDKDELCYIEKQEEFGDIFYTTRCLSQQLCHSDSNILFGKRNALKTTCKSCCQGDLCNDKCSTTVHAQTSPMPRTTASTTVQTKTSSMPENTDISMFNCDFESGVCNWIQDRTDTFDWTRHRGSTASTSTGPVADHTLGTSDGYYMYIEASAPRRPGDKARLLSPSVSLTDGIPKCMSFWYNMYGNNLGTLTIYIQNVNTQNKLEQKWTLSGSQGQGWHYGHFSFSGNKTVNVVVEGTRGLGYLGDIAIDDVFLQSGLC